uniref:Uncharacterized protein n=1 Tax=Romanomermis culicivorax TaxID=13658 RepID=A0A915J4T7_ROMCU
MFLNSSKTAVFCIFFVFLSYGAVKLLALSEIYEDLSDVPWFWILLTSNSIFTILACLIWVRVLCNIEIDNDLALLASAGLLKNVETGRTSTLKSPTQMENEEDQPLVRDSWSKNENLTDKSTTVEENSSPPPNNRNVNPKFLPDNEEQKSPDFLVKRHPKAEKTSSNSTVLRHRDTMTDFDTSSADSRIFGLNLDKQTSATTQRRDSLILGSKIIGDVNVTQTASLMFRLLKYCQQEWIWYTMGFIFLFCYSVARIFIPWYTSRVISNIVVDHSHEHLFQSILHMIILSVFSSVFSGLRAGCFMYAIAKVNVKIRSQLFESLVRQEIGFFDTTKTGEITSRLTSDCQVMSDTVATNVNLFLRSAIMFVGGIIVMVNLSWRMTLMIFIVMPLIALISKVYGTYYDSLASRGQDALAKTNEVAEEVIGSMRTVRSFANEEGESRRYNTSLIETLKIGKSKSLAFTGFTWINEWIDLIVLAAVLWYGGHLVLTGRMEKENLIAYLLYQLLLAESLINMGSVYTGLMQAVGSSRRVFQLIDRRPAILNAGSIVKKTLHGRIEFKNVSFAYPTRPNSKVLTNVSFTVKPGEICALVGPSGSGKSSCIALLEHFYEPLSGRILLDDVPVAAYDHQFYHKTVSLVGQEPVLYAKSVSENIGYALESKAYDQEDVIRAAKLANAHQFIVVLNKGYETNVGEKGLQLSGGQKQRIAIARAMVRKPRVLLLDEATSALDAESEHMVQNALYENLSGYTVLLIAHRLSTVRRAHRIIVIDKGRVVQQGSHDNLMQQDGLYKNLVQRQLLGEWEAKEEAGGSAM